MADNKRTCTFDGCEQPHEARGYCEAHYRQLRLGRPLTPIQRHAKPGMELRDRFDMYTDKTGECWVWTASKDAHGYGQIRIGNKRIRAHRAAYALAYGPIPEGLHIDHKCHTPACVNPKHLRACTNKQNSENRAGASANSKSGVRGVYWNKALAKWKGQVGHNGQGIYVGLFATIEEAEAAVIAKRNELFTHSDADWN